MPLFDRNAEPNRVNGFTRFVFDLVQWVVVTAGIKFVGLDAHQPRLVWLGFALQQLISLYFIANTVGRIKLTYRPEFPIIRYVVLIIFPAILIYGGSSISIYRVTDYIVEAVIHVQENAEVHPNLAAPQSPSPAQPPLPLAHQKPSRQPG